ncbi:MAG: SPOR domain-containing protein, partial [Winogradskyella sp.]|nr:SPOR domain-containing protein [Winogradskyella sp.]
LNAQEGTVTVVQDKDIDKLLEFNKDTRTQDVFKIQIFQGERSRAEQEMKEFQSIYGQWPVSMRFNTPNYKIWVGNFTNRLEADRALVRIKRNYMNAFIFQPKDD